MPPRLPSHAVHVPTYAELEHYVRAFAEGHFNLLLLFGSPGVGKSRAVRQALAGPLCWIGGQATGKTEAINPLVELAGPIPGGTQVCGTYSPWWTISVCASFSFSCVVNA